MGKHTQGPNLQMILQAKAMIKNGHSVEWVDATMLSEYQGKKGLKACKDAIAIARMELAAPDLLEALELIANDDPRNKKQMNLSMVREIARAATAKAKGEV